jgi:hypothetical protein
MKSQKEEMPKNNEITKTTEYIEDSCLVNSTVIPSIIETSRMSKWSDPQTEVRNISKRHIRELTVDIENIEVPVELQSQRTGLESHNSPSDLKEK